jgi:hypothetical protein
VPTGPVSVLGTGKPKPADPLKSERDITALKVALQDFLDDARDALMRESLDVGQNQKNQEI